MVDYLICVQAAWARRGRAVASLDLLPLQRADLAAPPRPLHTRTRQVQTRPRYIYVSTYLHIYISIHQPRRPLLRCGAAAGAGPRAGAAAHRRGRRGVRDGRELRPGGGDLQTELGGQRGVRGRQVGGGYNAAVRITKYDSVSAARST